MKGSLKEYGPLACTNKNHSFLFLVETIWRAVVAAFHVLMETQQYFQHLTTSYSLTPSHNTIHHQGAGQQEELCTIIPGYHPGNMELIYFWSPQIFLQRMEGWWERHEMGGKCRACFVHFNILTCCRVPPRFPGNRGHSMLTLIL